MAAIMRPAIRRALALLSGAMAVASGVVVPGASAQALDALQCKVTIVCDKEELSIEFDSRSKDCPSGQSTLTLRSGAATKTVGIPPGSYQPLLHDISQTQSGVCTAGGEAPLTDYRTQGGQIILFTVELSRRAGESGLHRVVAFLVDGKKPALLARRDLGLSKDRQALGVVPVAGGFRLRIVRQRSIPGITCHCAAEKIDDWLEVAVRNGRITTRWLR